MPIYFNTASSQLAVSLESIGNKWPQVSVQRASGHPLYHWLQTETGCGEIWIEKQQITLLPGQGILIAPFVPHGYYPKTADWQTNFVTFDGVLKNEFRKILRNDSFILAQDSTVFSYQKQVAHMIYLHQEEHNSVELSVACYRFLTILSQGQQPVEEHELFKKIVQPGLKIMQTQFQENLTIEQIAQSLYISPQYFSRLFKKFVDQSPYQYLIDIRIRHAKELLVNEPDLPIQIVALKVGFESVSQFIEVFKKKTQYTPRKFRQLY